MVRTELNRELAFNVNGYHFLRSSYIVRLYHELNVSGDYFETSLSCAHMSAIVLSRNICSCRPTLYATDLL